MLNAATASFFLFRFQNLDIRLSIGHLHVSLVASDPFSRQGIWGISSVGRALALQAKGQEFDSPILHHLKKIATEVQ